MGPPPEKRIPSNGELLVHACSTDWPGQAGCSMQRHYIRQSLSHDGLETCCRCTSQQKHSTAASLLIFEIPRFA